MPIFYFLIFFPFLCFSQINKFEDIFESIEEVKIPEVKNCTAIAVDGNLMFIGDSDQHKIFIYEDGKFKKSFGRLSKKKDGIEYIMAMNIDPIKKRLYVKANLFGILIYDYDGNLIDIIEMDLKFYPRKAIFYKYILYTVNPHVTPTVVAFKEGKIFKGFGEYDSNLLIYDDGSVISMDVSEDGIYVAYPLSYPILLYDFDGNLKKKIGEKIQLKKSYKNFNIKDYKGSITFMLDNYDIITDLYVLKNNIISIAKETIDNKWRYYLNIFDKNGNLIIKELEGGYNFFIGRHNDYLFYLTEDKKLFKGKYKGVGK